MAYAGRERHVGSNCRHDVIDPLVALVVRVINADGILACGTTGEGVLLSVDERRRLAELFVAGSLPVAVHCGAQTTADTVALAAHAAEAGAAAVAVIAPPYFPLDDVALKLHFEAAAAACAPLPFYVYEFEARSGYAVLAATVLLTAMTWLYVFLA